VKAVSILNCFELLTLTFFNIKSCSSGDISGSHGKECEDVSSRMLRPVFWYKLTGVSDMFTHSVLSIALMMEAVPLKHRSVSTRLHDATSQKSLSLQSVFVCTNARYTPLPCTNTATVRQQSFAVICRSPSAFRHCIFWYITLSLLRL
jgi:hypothetical protein